MALSLWDLYLIDPSTDNFTTFVVLIVQRHCVKLRTIGEVRRLGDQRLVDRFLAADHQEVSAHNTVIRPKVV